MENFHPLRRTPSHADALNSAHCCTEFTQGCAELAHKKLCQIYCICLRKILCWPFLVLWNFVDLFLATSKIFVDLFWFFGHFLDLFWLVSPVMCAKIPLCTKNSVTLMCQVWRMPYYAGRTPKFSAQSRYYTRHIRHKVYFFQSGIWAHIHAYAFHKHYFYVIPIQWHSQSVGARGEISHLVWVHQTLELICLEPHAFGLHAVV